MNSKQKVLACYPHVLTSSIGKMIGESKQYPYTVLLRLGLPVKAREKRIDRIPTHLKDEWRNI